MPKTVFYAMEPVYLQTYIDLKNQISAGSINLSAEVIDKIKAQIQDFRTENRELFTIDDEKTAHISVAGPLEPKPDPCAMLFDIDMTTYGDIIDAARAADADPNVEKVIFHFSTPGGNIVGLFKTADVIRGMTKPTEAVIHDLCCSAGIALATQCDTITAENAAAETGSIGVLMEKTDFTEAEKMRGEKRFILTSDNAPDKRPDIKTDAGRLKIIERLTKLEAVFIDYVAVGRNVTPDFVIENFGKGGVLIARDAIAAGLIDSITSDIKTPAGKATRTGNQTRGESEMGDITMTDEQLQKFGEDIANKTAGKVTTDITAKMEADKQTRLAEDKRKSGFTALLAAYPKQATLINTEMEKADAEATAEFAIKVGAAETSRLSAEKEQLDAADDQAGDQGAGTGAADDKSGDDFIKTMEGA